METLLIVTLISVFRCGCGKNECAYLESTHPSRAPETKKKRSQEILAVMLSTAGNKVVEKVLSKALDDDDKDQTICLKMVMDRVIPQDYMQRVKSGNKIEIQISGVDSPVNINEVQTIDAVDSTTC